ncbi:acyl carrier protein phosphodiesterase [Tellurirhabdus bombi]|uniref:acyl carrier protein phosphodiesterase n=1 Tax=Tellurirhabdus bombi TaxID=2907205 RepID=UPI001F3930CF|nr:ACP phosphodiesterase [Tellurirhabdus bombi]
MNILAHAFLSGGDEHLLIGNFIADFIKGDPGHPRHGLSVEVQRGVRLHRQIDSFTDTHSLVEELRIIVRPRCRKYAGAAIDVFFDYFLANRFSQLADEPLEGFVQNFYGVIRRRQESLPVAAHRMADYMIQQDWLTAYRTLEGIDRSLKGMSRRTAFPSNLDTAVDDLRQHYAAFESGFALFFPQLKAAVRQWLVDN